MLKNLKVFYKLLIAFVLILSLFILSGLLSTRVVNNINNTINDFYEHPFFVSNAVKQIIIEINSAHEIIDEMYKETDEKLITEKQIEFTQLDAKIFDELREVEIRFLGDKQKVVALREALKKSSELHTELINYIIDGNYEKVDELRATHGNSLETEIDSLAEELLLVANYKAESFIKKAESTNEAQKTTLTYIIIFSSVGLIGIAYILSRSISNPLKKLIKAIEISKSPDSIIKLDTIRNDEIGSVSKSFVEMIEHSRQREKDQINLQKEMFQNLFENISSGVFLNEVILNENNEPVDFHIKDANASSYKILDAETPETETKAKSFSTYHKDVFIDLVFRAKTEDVLVAEEKYVKELNKTLFINAFPTVKDEIMVLFDDITERKKSEKTIRDLNKSLEDKVKFRTRQLENSNRELESFSYSVSHDLRAPLRHVSGYISLLISKYGKEVSEGARRYLDIIEDSANKMNLLINGLLEFSRTGRKEIVKQRFDNNEIVNNVIETMKEVIGDRKITWKIGELGEGFADSSLITLVWQNLISNAIKYTSKEEVAIVEIGKYEEKEYNVYYVKDNGVGFDMKYYDKIFAVFQRLHADSDFQGIGIGLANAQRIILMHEGELWAESEVGKGTEFYFKLRREEK